MGETKLRTKFAGTARLPRSQPWGSLGAPSSEPLECFYIYTETFTNALDVGLPHLYS